MGELLERAENSGMKMEQPIKKTYMNAYMNSSKNYYNLLMQTFSTKSICHQESKCGSQLPLEITKILITEFPALKQTIES